MQCAIFALVGVVVGELAVLLARGELGIFKRRRTDQYFTAGEVDESKIKSEAELMQQWQNLLSYGAEKNING